MTGVGKLLLFPVLLGVGRVSAGVYGMLHDQVSYTVSPDYFHAFKFRQFATPAALHGRAGAALVGWAASWWMGLFIGVPVLTVGLVVPGWRAYLKHALIAFGVVTLTASAVGLAALAGACWLVTQGTLPDFHYPSEVTDRVAFARVGTMHNFSYLGGFLGIVTGSVYLAVVAFRLRSRTPPPA